MAKVKILPDTDLPDALDDVRPKSQCRLCFLGSDDDDVKVAVDKQGRILSCVRMKQRSKVSAKWHVCFIGKKTYG